MSHSKRTCYEFAQLHLGLFLEAVHLGFCFVLLRLRRASLTGLLHGSNSRVGCRKAVTHVYTCQHEGDTKARALSPHPKPPDVNKSDPVRSDASVSLQRLRMVPNRSSRIFPFSRCVSPESSAS